MKKETIEKQLKQFEKETNKKVKINNIHTDKLNFDFEIDFINADINGKNVILYVVEKNNYAVNLKTNEWSNNLENLLKKL